jgi:hypothetical protein
VAESEAEEDDFDVDSLFKNMQSVLEEDGYSIKHPNDLFIWFKLAFIGMDFIYSITKTYIMYSTNFYFYDSGRYLGRLVSDSIAIVDTAVNSKKLKAYWNAHYDMVEEKTEIIAERKKNKKKERGEGDASETDDGSEAEDGEEVEDISEEE